MGSINPAEGNKAMLTHSLDANAARLVEASAFYVDAQARLDVPDILKQIAWYKALGLVEPGVDAPATLDLSFVKGHFGAP